MRRAKIVHVLSMMLFGGLFCATAFGDKGRGRHKHFSLTPVPGPVKMDGHLDNRMRNWSKGRPGVLWSFTLAGVLAALALTVDAQQQVDRWPIRYRIERPVRQGASRTYLGSPAG